MQRTQPNLVLIVARSFATKLATPTLIIDADGDLVYFNDAAAEVLGSSYLDVGALDASRWQELFQPRTLDEDPLTPAETPGGVALLERRGRYTTRSRFEGSTGASAKSPSRRFRSSPILTRW
jgi:PAS domain-containing protein